MFPEFLFLCYFLASFIFLSVSCQSLQLDVARYACVTKTGKMLDNKAQCKNDQGRKCLFHNSMDLNTSQKVAKIIKTKYKHKRFKKVTRDFCKTSYR